MTVRTSFRASAPRLLAALSVGVVAGLSAGLASTTRAVAGEDPFGVSAPRPVRHHRPARPDAPLPPHPRAAIVGGYLPRNNNLPMYNAPPDRDPAR